MDRLRRLGAGATVLGLAVAASSSGLPPAAATIDEALGLDRGSAAGSLLERRRALAVESITARCMSARGFAYVGVPAAPPLIPDADLGPIEWARRWGFGISTSVGVDLLPRATDPVMERLSRLSPVERTRYTAALAPCRSTASDAVYGLRDRLMRPLEAALVGLRGRISMTPDMTTARDAWRRCVRRAGLTAADRAAVMRAVMTAITTRLANLTNAADLPALQDEERDVATALATCELAFVDAVAPVHAEAERAFVRDHDQELRRIGAAIRRAESTWPSP